MFARLLFKSSLYSKNTSLPLISLVSIQERLLIEGGINGVVMVDTFILWFYCQILSLFALVLNIASAKLVDIVVELELFITSPPWGRFSTWPPLVTIRIAFWRESEVSLSCPFESVATGTKTLVLFAITFWVVSMGSSLMELFKILIWKNKEFIIEYQGKQSCETSVTI